MTVQGDLGLGCQFDTNGDGDCGRPACQTCYPDPPPRAVPMTAITFTEAEIAAGLKHLNSAWVSQDEAAKSLIAKLEKAAPHLCGYCFQDSTTGSHTMAKCSTATGEVIKRG